METDRHYFIVGVFIIGISAAAAFVFLWLAASDHRDDVLFRIHFKESVSGLAVGDPVKFHGIDVGTVQAMALDPADPRQAQVDVRLRKEAPVKTDTRAYLKMKGITGVVFIELNGGAPGAQRLVAVTPKGQIPEIVSETSSLTTVLDQLPKVIEKFSAIEDQTRTVLTGIGDVTGKLKNNPLLQLGAPSDKAAPSTSKPTGRSQTPRAPHIR